MIDGAFFRKINPNHSRPQINEPANIKSGTSAIDVDLFSEISSEPPPDQVKSNGMEPTEMKENELLIYCLTVPGFSFGDKLWGEILAL